MSLSRLQTKAMAALRRVARRPRAWVRTARSHDAAVTAQRRTRLGVGRASLALRSLRGRRARDASWAALADEVAALPAPPELSRTVSTVTFAAPGGAAAARAAAAESECDLICFALGSNATLEAEWLPRLATAIGGTIDGETVVAATPLVVHPMRAPTMSTPDDGRVRARGLELDVAFDAPVVRAREAGAQPVLDAPTALVAGATAACLLVDRAAYLNAGGLPDLADLDLAVFELCRRLRANRGGIAAVSDAVVVDPRPVPTRAALTHPIPTDTAAWRSYIEEYGPALMSEVRPLPAGRLRIALTVAAPSEKVAPRWGDWHLAQAFADALRRRGHVVRVQTLDHADDLAGRACDVHCVVRGLQSVRRTPGQAHVLWIISHPESIDTAECDAADLVLVASVRFAESLRTRTRTPVEVMLQATDPDRFRPQRPDPAHAHDVVIVAKSRDVFRPIVADAIAAGIEPSIYGNGWEQFVDPALVVAAYVPNDILAVVYSSAGVLLNDHWDTMREWEFVLNRLFDALSCGTPVISDHLDEIDPLFAGAVPTYRTVEELRELVESMLADPTGARERAARGGALVRGQHTFGHRADELLAALQRHDLA